MRRLLLITVLLSVGVAATAADPDPKSLAVPADVAARAAVLVADLGDRDFAVRDAATKELRRLGRLALPALRDARATISHAEVRQRVELLLPMAVADDRRARLDCLLADTTDKYQHELPGGTVFFAATGRAAAAKKLFADIVRSANRELLAAIEDGPEAELRRLYTARRAEVGLQANSAAAKKAATATAIDVAALLLAESRLPESPARTAIAARKTTVLTNAAAQTALRAGGSTNPRAAVSGDIVRAWAETRQQPVLLDVALGYFDREGLPHGLPAARRLAVAEVTLGATSYHGHAIAYLGRFGGADDMALLETLFDDSRVLSTSIQGIGNKRKVVQFRDVALVSALRIAKLDLSDYGLTYRYAPAKPTVGSLPDSDSYYFAADTAAGADALRDAAVTKYAAWKRAQPKDE